MSAPSVLITGASSGIGRACATCLAQRGWRVFAGVRKQKDADSLTAQSPTLIPVALEVTDAASIAAAMQVVRQRLDDRGLDGLVNNAGVGVVTPLEYTSGELLRQQFEVDVFGQIAVTQAFLPLIREARGRIVNMCSIGDRITIPFFGVLCACKSALAALTDALRLELRPFGIHVSMIEPATIATPAVDKTRDASEAALRALPPEGAARYAEMMRTFLRHGYEREQHGSPPEVVARAVHHALSSPRPRVRYPVGKNATILATLPKIIPAALLDRIRLRLFGLPTKFGSAFDDRAPMAR